MSDPNESWNPIQKIISHLLFIFATSFAFRFADAFIFADLTQLLLDRKNMILGIFSSNIIANNNEPLTSYYTRSIAGLMTIITLC